MSSFLDKAKDKTKQLAEQAKEKVEDVKDARKADGLLEDIGRLVYRQRVKGNLDTDDARLDELVSQLKELEASGTQIIKE